MSDEALKSYIERIERLEEEKAAIAEDIREVYAEAKAAGFDVKAMRAVVRIRKRLRSEGRQALEEEQTMIDLYLSRLGDLPLFSSAEEKTAA